MSPEEQRLLANNLINILLGRGLPKEPCLLDPDAQSAGSTLSLREAVEEFLRDHMAARSRPKDQAFLDVLLEGIEDTQHPSGKQQPQPKQGLGPHEGLLTQPQPPMLPRQLTPEELELSPRSIVADVMAQHPDLTYERAVWHLRMAGM
jgi:hypothetical protein